MRCLSHLRSTALHEGLCYESTSGRTSEIEVGQRWGLRTCTAHGRTAVPSRRQWLSPISSVPVGNPR